MKQTILVSVLALALALSLGCGGGGGGGAGSVVSIPQEVAQQILETCGADGLLAFIDLMQDFAAVTDSSATLPPIVITGTTGDMPPTGVTWTLDVDGDNVDDFIGQIQFFDQAGMPAAPFDMNDLVSGGIGALANLLQSVPDGTRMQIDFAGAGPVPAGGGIAFTFSGGVTQTASGQLTSPEPTCSTTFDFIDVPAAGLFGAFPTMVLSALIEAAEGVVQGEVTLDGTAVAVAVVTLSAEPDDEFTFEIDLTDGTVTAVP